MSDVRTILEPMEVTSWTTLLFYASCNGDTLSEILGSHVSGYRDNSLLGYSAVYTVTIPTFQRCVLLPSSGLSTRCYIPEGCHLQDPLISFGGEVCVEGHRTSLLCLSFTHFILQSHTHRVKACNSDCVERREVTIDCSMHSEKPRSLT
jgi:hypothetical protein